MSERARYLLLLLSSPLLLGAMLVLLLLIESIACVGKFGLANTRGGSTWFATTLPRARSGADAGAS